METKICLSRRYSMILKNRKFFFESKKVCIFDLTIRENLPIASFVEQGTFKDVTH